MAASRKTPPDLLDTLIQHWPDALSGQCRLELALSGGMDSVVLLDLLCRWRDERGGPAFSALHVHHGLSAQADDWVRACEDWCRARQVPLRVVRVAVQAGGGDSLEAEARKARYQAFAEGGAEVIAVAHHADDQSETVLLQVLRGGGPRALAAMPLLREHQGQQLWRPLLKVGRSALAAYAAARQLQWVEDDSNADTDHFLRNFLRHEVMGRLRQRAPALDKQLARLAQRMADAAEMVDALAAMDLAQVQRGRELDLPALLALSDARQRHVVLAWLAQLGLALPSPESLYSWLAQVRSAAAATQPLLEYQSLVLLRYRQRLLALPRVAPQPWPLCCVVGETLRLPHGELSWRRAQGGLPDDWHGRLLDVMPRSGGEKLPLKVGRKPVKTVFQEAGVPPQLRLDWPLLEDDAGELLAVPSLGVSVLHAAAGEGWWPQWQPLAIVSRPAGD